MKNRNLDNSVHWKTPAYIYDPLNDEFDFEFDPCPLHHDISKWDGLQVDWPQRSFINPPYTRALKEAFVKRAIAESMNGKLCVCLLPVSTSTVLFHGYILPFKKEIRFVEKRIKFIGINTFGKEVKGKCGMFDSMVVIFDGR